MEFTNREFCLEVSGDFACFTRPEFKVERVSYDIITPSAVRAIFESILWKPAMRWNPTKIEILPATGEVDEAIEWPHWTSVRRNEVGAVAGRGANQIFIEDRRQQKASRILRDVRYRLYAELEFIPFSKRNPEGQSREGQSDENPAKYYAMFERRARKGQTFNHPYLGCREFSCNEVLFLEDTEPRSPILPVTRDLGFMLYDMDFSDEIHIEPMFFRAQVNQGILVIPAKNSPEVMK